MHTEKITTCSEIIKKRRRNLEIKKEYIRLLARIAILTAIAWILCSQVFLVCQAPDNDMFPAVKNGDLLIGFRLQKNFLKNDVVVYEINGEMRAGRILGRETDVITMDESGTLLVNGTAQSGEILFPTYAKEALEYPYTVPKGCVFILGDYRTQAEDSRDFGCIRVKDVKAKVITILRRRVL